MNLKNLPLKILVLLIKKTKDFRNQCSDLGFDVVFSNGMSNEQVIKLLTKIGDKK